MDSPSRRRPFTLENLPKASQSANGRVSLHVASSRFRSGRANTTSGTNVSRTKQNLWQDEEDRLAQKALKGLSAGTKRTLAEISGGDSPEDFADIDHWTVDNNNPDDWEDEQHELDAEGGISGLLEEFTKQSSTRGIYMGQSWSERIARQEARWKEQLPDLVDAYLEFKHKSAPAADTSTAAFHLPFLDVFDYSSSKELHHIAGSRYTVNATLLRQGCLGGAPEEVSFVVSLRTLELYRRLRLHQPRVSVQAWIRTICDLHNISYRRSYWRYFTDVFDIYLKILREIDDRVNNALGRTSPDWRVKSSCPCCQYKLVEQEPMEVEIIGACDGGQSLKCMRPREGKASDPRVFKGPSEYFLSETFVDRFKYDVKARMPKSAEKKDGGVDEPAWSLGSNPQASAADGDDELATCTERWKAAMNDYLKRMWAIYRETGIFISACRHGFVWWICDMIESGELAKYPLAMVSKILSTFCERIGLGYDIGCSFTATVMKSSLSNEARRKALRLVVNAFHGYAHHRSCQLRFHPLYVTGFGIEDIETCERIFAAFNGLAPTTRHATRFHRHQAIDGFARHWDEQKYQELGSFLFNNYRQVQQILDELPIAIKALQSGKTREDTQYHLHLEAERTYLDSRKKGDDAANEMGCEYVDLLQKHDACMKTFDDAIQHCSNLPPGAEWPARVEAAKRRAFENLEQVRTMLHAFEIQHEISERWTPDSEPYKYAVKNTNTRKYQKALEKLEGLVVQRLFELAKMGLSGTGYKMRMHINKSLKTRCRAIQNALKRYNAAAKEIGRQPLEWSDVSTYGSLAEFELLKECRQDIRSLPWTDSKNRQAGIHALKIERAKEERVRLNVEIRNLISSMQDEEIDFRYHIGRLQESDLLLSLELQSVLARRNRMNHANRVRIEQIFTLSCFTGSKEPGTRIGRAAPMVEDVIALGGGNVLDDLDEAEMDGMPDAPDEDDAAGDLLNRVTDYIANMAIVE